MIQHFFTALMARYFELFNKKVNVLLTQGIFNCVNFNTKVLKSQLTFTSLIGTLNPGPFNSQKTTMITSLYHWAISSFLCERAVRNNINLMKMITS